MELSIKRVIMFTRQIDAMAMFYRDVIGLRQVADEPGWKDFAAGGCNLSLHRGSSEVGKRAPKLVFYSADVAATREALIKRGASMGKVKSGAGLDLCEGHDPDGNPFQISNRR
ncbi:MAG TPA: VOC family protein [Candidatus Binataceae bacterium]|nr:VOC family protein [Candidatus Binataceae bacterium]